MKGFNLFLRVISNAIPVQERFLSLREAERDRDSDARFNEMQLDI